MERPAHPRAHKLAVWKVGCLTAYCSTELKVACRGFGEMRPFEGMLEANLPGENRAEKNVVRRVNEEFAGSVCEFKGIGDNPRSYIR